MVPGNTFEKARAAVGKLNPGVHACAFYREREEEVAMAVAYVRAGLDRNELCVCIVDDGGRSVADALSAEGVDVDTELRKGRLVLFEKRLAGNLRPLDMLAKIEGWTQGAREAGYSGCRVAGEMTWALDGGLRDLAEFEARLNLNQVYERHACIGLCQFDMQRFSPELLREMILLHPFVVVGDRVCRNPYFVAPEHYLSPDWPRQETDWMIKNLEELQQAQDDLQASEESYRSLTRRMVDLQENERREVSRELHDRVGQTLTAMHINMDLIRTRLDEHDDSLIRARNDDSLLLIDSTFKAVQNVMYDLRPPMLDSYGFVAALRWYAREFPGRSGIRVDIRGAEGARLGPEIEIALFRIAQEALNNVARHSQAKNVRIELREAADEAVLTIEDDGVGPGTAAERSGKVGYGLITMRERAEAVGGTFEAGPGKERGMRIAVHVPRKP